MGLKALEGDANMIIIEEEARVKASEEFHNHPSNPSSCEIFEKNYMKRCICEDNWIKFVNKKD